MPGGVLTEYVKNHPDTDRLDLAGAPPVLFDPTLTSTASSPMSLTASVFSTPAT